MPGHADRDKNQMPKVKKNIAIKWLLNQTNTKSKEQVYRYFGTFCIFAV